MNVLRSIRESKMMSRDELAKASGISEGGIFRLENDQHRPRFETLRKLAQGLGVEPKELVSLRDGKENQ